MIEQKKQKEIAAYYSTLSNGEKGRFTAFVSLRLGSSPHTWQQKFLRWAQNEYVRPLSPVIEKELSAIISSGCWRISSEDE